MTGRRFSPDTPVSSTNKTDRQEITEILLKVALNTITSCFMHVVVNTIYGRAQNDHDNKHLIVYSTILTLLM